ncbi:hypothetical protein GF325_11780 [Candidatus Bathyarchaeota archaeon]|nr:hypothetical protein [Candidatus Bathyarchaeota archaeon]
MGDEELNFDDLDSLVEPVDKPKNKEKMIEVLGTAFDNGTPFIDYCKMYVYALMPMDADGNEWKEYSFIREDGALTKDKRDKEMAFLVIKEEVVRGLPEVVEGLNVTKVNEIADDHVNDPKGFIADLMEKMPELPLIREKGELQKAIDLVKSA